MEANHVVYILECADGTYYTGYTNRLDQRVANHQKGKGAKYTRGRTPVKVVYTENYTSKIEAMRREYAIKRLSRQNKKELINGGTYEDSDKFSK